MGTDGQAQGPNLTTSSTPCPYSTTAEAHEVRVLPE
jgi:hypothetical protein